MIQKSIYTGAAAVSIALDAGQVQIERIEVHLSAAGGAAENLVVKLDALAGAAYDVVYLTEDMDTVTDIVFQPDRPLEFVNGDKLVITYTNTNTRTYGISVYYKNH